MKNPQNAIETIATSPSFLKKDTIVITAKIIAAGRDDTFELDNTCLLSNTDWPSGPIEAGFTYSYALISDGLQIVEERLYRENLLVHSQPVVDTPALHSRIVLVLNRDIELTEVCIRVYNHNDFVNMDNTGVEKDIYCDTYIWETVSTSEDGLNVDYPAGQNAFGNDGALVRMVNQPEIYLAYKPKINQPYEAIK